MVSAESNGAGAAVQLAQLDTGLGLTPGDFIFIEGPEPSPSVRSPLLTLATLRT